jgi:hypothetical protein
MITLSEITCQPPTPYLTYLIIIILYFIVKPNYGIVQNKIHETKHFSDVLNAFKYEGYKQQNCTSQSYVPLIWTNEVHPFENACLLNLRYFCSFQQQTIEQFSFDFDRFSSLL